MLCENLFLIGNTVARSSKQLKISQGNCPYQFFSLFSIHWPGGLLKKINFQIKHGKYDSIMASYQNIPLVTRGLLPHVLKYIHKTYHRFGVISPCTTLPCPLHKNTFVFPSFEPNREYKWTPIRKENFLICCSPLSSQAEQKEDDEPFANPLQIYVSRIFPKAKKSALCTEYPMSSKFHLSKWKTYFSKFIQFIHRLKIKIFGCWCLVVVTFNT